MAERSLSHSPCAILGNSHNNYLNAYLDVSELRTEYHGGKLTAKKIRDPTQLRKYGDFPARKIHFPRYLRMQPFHARQPVHNWRKSTEKKLMEMAQECVPRHQKLVPINEPRSPRTRIHPSPLSYSNAMTKVCETVLKNRQHQMALMSRPNDFFRSSHKFQRIKGFQLFEDKGSRELSIDVSSRRPSDSDTTAVSKAYAQDRARRAEKDVSLNSNTSSTLSKTHSCGFNINNNKSELSDSVFAQCLKKHTKSNSTSRLHNINKPAEAVVGLNKIHPFYEEIKKRRSSSRCSSSSSNHINDIHPLEEDGRKPLSTNQKIFSHCHTGTDGFIPRSVLLDNNLRGASSDPFSSPLSSQGPKLNLMTHVTVINNKFSTNTNNINPSIQSRQLYYTEPTTTTTLLQSSSPFDSRKGSHLNSSRGRFQEIGLREFEQVVNASWPRGETR